jgi:hypothetical protein
MANLKGGYLFIIAVIQNQRQQYGFGGTLPVGFCL